MTSKWKQITYEDVVRAIKRYDENQINAYAKSTCVKYKENRYPAKYIRALAKKRLLAKRLIGPSFQAAVK